MQCTNYSAEPFRSIKSMYNEAAADYIASIMETDDFQKWYGKKELTPLKESYFVTNSSGEEWSVYNSLDGWRKAHERAAGFENRDVDINDLEGVSKLREEASAYNLKGGPFVARVGRMRNEGEERNYLYLSYNDKYNKEHAKGLIQVDPSEKDRERPETDHIFHMENNISEEDLKSGNKISARQEILKEGVYKIGEGYYRVKLRNRSAVYAKNSSINPSELRKRILDDGGLSLRFREDFLNGKLPMFLYDITPVHDLKADAAKAMPDFIGTMAIKPNKKAKGARFLTGYADVDKYIKALVEHRTALYTQRVAVKSDLKKVQEINAKIAVTTDQLETLKKDPTVDAINFVGRNMMLRIKRELDNANSFDTMNEALRLSKAWKEIDQVIDFNPKDPSAEDLQMLSDAREVRDMASTLFQSYYRKYTNKLLDMIDAELDPSTGRYGKSRSSEVVDDEGNIKLMDIDKVGALTITGAFSSNAIEQLTHKLLSEAEMMASDENYDVERRIKEAVSEFLGKEPEKTKASEFNFLFTKDTHGNQALVKKYDNAFYKQLYTKAYQAFDQHRMSQNRSENYSAAIALGATADELKEKLSPKEYYEFEKQHYNYVLTDDGKREFEHYMEQQKQALYTGENDENGDPIYNQKAYDHIYKEYNPETFAKWIAGDKEAKYNKGGYWFTKQMKDNVGISKEYKSMNEKQRSFYDFFVKEFTEGQQEFIKDFRYNETEVDRQLIDFVLDAPASMKGKVGYMGKQFRDFVYDIATVKYVEDTEVDKPTRALTGVEHIGAQFKSIDNFIPDGAKPGTAHPLHILEQFLKAGNMFKQKRRIEDSLNAIRDLTLNAEKINTTSDDRIKTDLIGKVYSTKNKTNLADRIEHTIKSQLTERRTDPYKASSQGKPGERKFSADKTVDSINNYTRFRMMALAPLSSAGNLIMGTVNNFTYSAANQYFNDKELAHAYYIMKMSVSKYYTHGIVKDKNAVKVATIMRRYGILGDVNEKNLTHSELMSWFFTLNESGEFMNQGATAVAQMLRQKVDLADGTQKSLWDMYSVDKEGLLEFANDKLAEDSPWNDRKTVHNFFEKVKKVNWKIHGDYHNPMMIKKDVLGRVLMTFRTWLPMAIKDRFGKEYQDALLGAQKGRYRSAAGVFTKGVKGIFTHNWADAAEMGKLVAKVLLPILTKRVRFGSRLSEVDRNNLNMFVREMHFAMVITASIIAAKAAMGDADDEEKDMLRYVYNQLQRSQSEMMFFFYPSDTMQIIRDVVPLYSTLKDGTRVLSRSWNFLFDPQADLYKNGFRKGQSKFGVAFQEFLPVTRSVQKTWAATAQVFNNSQYR